MQNIQEQWDAMSAAYSTKVQEKHCSYLRKRENDTANVDNVNNQGSWAKDLEEFVILFLKFSYIFEII